MDHNQLAQVESLCQSLYQGTSSAQRAEAQQQLLALQTSAEYIPQCQFILDNSSQPFAQVMASTSLEMLITQFWNNFTVEQKLEIRNYILNYLATHAHNLQDFVIGSLSKLACRITKLGWFDSPEHREIIEETSKFLEATVNHHIIGLRLLNSLVDEMNTPTTGRTLTLHRKTAVSFRDHALFQTFQIAITTLRQLQLQVMESVGSSDRDKMAASALTLATACLSFDFIGTNPEESTEDVGTVQVPSSWRPIVQDTSTIQLFFDFYLTSDPPRSSLALQSLVQLSSVRRSLFPSEKERTIFLQALMTGIHSIMQSKKGLDHVENYHEFCRLLGRLKASYQLSELVKTTGFIEWLELASDFTIKSLLNWQYSMNSIHYLLALWGRLVAALPYLRSDANDSQRQAQTLRQCVLQVVESYIKSMLDSVEIVLTSDGGIEDPLDDEGSLKEQMDRLPVIARLQYDTVAQYLITLFEQVLGHYQEGLLLPPSPTVTLQIRALEGRMTWLTYMVGAIIGAQTAADPRKNQGELLWDGRLSRCVFQLVQTIDYRLNSSVGKSKCDDKLEIAILAYFRSFKKSYMLDTVNAPAGMGVVPGGSPAHPLLSLALSYSPGVGGGDGKDGSADVNSVSVQLNDMYSTERIDR
jgi:exportin-7